MSFLTIPVTHHYYIIIENVFNCGRKVESDIGLIVVSIGILPVCRVIARRLELLATAVLTGTHRPTCRPKFTQIIQYPVPIITNLSCETSCLP